ncbi:glycine betaine ABC transporter substrate-binding protein [Dehalobacter sp. DCM]|uniref:glycine betaine ABC transporter substrate-binding protein n=1 Tax=Dehalobacter sp. DCM TaxID=2907827 RepID=UPI0030813E05|nr:glycine betaine ABC transporter substrate-binding protein [Dehalobacter sp. DCM]
MMHLFKGRKLLVLTMIIVLVVSFTAGCSSTRQAADKGTVSIGYVNWAECVAVSNLWKVILEDQGYQVELTQLDVAPLFVGLSKGDLDVFMDAWLPITHETYWNEYQDSLEDYGIWYQEEAKIGIVVPKYVTIDSIAQLKDEGSKFNKQIIGIDPGAGIMKASVRANTTYDLGYDVVQGSEMAMMAAMDKAYGKNEWIAITGWSPHWMFAKYDLKYLDDPEGEFGEAEEIHILANKEFSGKQADVATMLKKFKMTDAQIGSLEGLINEGMEPAEAAKKWINENSDVVNGWIGKN